MSEVPRKLGDQEGAEAMKVTLYTAPGCGQCVATRSSLDSKGITYEIVDLSTDAAAVARVKNLGYLQAPVVITDDDHWSGFRPDKVNALAERMMDLVHADRADRRQ